MAKLNAVNRVEELAQKYSGQCEVTRPLTASKESPNLSFMEIEIRPGNSNNVVVVELVENKNNSLGAQLIAVKYLNGEYTDESPESLFEALDGILSGKIAEKKTLFGFGQKKYVVTGQSGKEYWPRD